jgi:hypothetical protein
MLALDPAAAVAAHSARAAADPLLNVHRLEQQQRQQQQEGSAHVCWDDIL